MPSYSSDPGDPTLYLLNVAGERTGETTTLYAATGGVYSAGETQFWVADNPFNRWSLGQQSAINWYVTEGQGLEVTYETTRRTAGQPLGATGQRMASGTVEVLLPSGNTTVVTYAGVSLGPVGIRVFSQDLGPAGVEFYKSFATGTSLAEVQRILGPQIMEANINQLLQSAVMGYLRKKETALVERVAQTEDIPPSPSGGTEFYAALTYIASAVAAGEARFSASQLMSLTEPGGTYYAGG